jgi:hypothetical protein
VPVQRWLMGEDVALPTLQRCAGVDAQLVGQPRPGGPQGAVEAVPALRSGGASVTESMLRRHLSGTAIDRSPSYAVAWRVLDALPETAETLVRFRLTGAGNNLELECAEAREALAAAMNTAASQASALVVAGEPSLCADRY